MAFESVKSDLRLGSKMEIGSELYGYVVDFPEGKYGPNILMEDKDENTFTFAVSGNVKYLIKDGLIRPGLYTRITRLEDKISKGKVSTQFDVAQDAGDVTANVRTGAVHSSASADTSAIKSRIDALKENVRTAGA